MIAKYYGPLIGLIRLIFANLLKRISENQSYQPNQWAFFYRPNQVAGFNCVRSNQISKCTSD